MKQFSKTLEESNTECLGLLLSVFEFFKSLEAVATLGIL